MSDVIKFIIEDIALLFSALFLIYLVYHDVKYYQDSGYKNFGKFILKFYRKHY
ncbi:MAG TPA: hypothetical protein GXZ48_04705, partial [Acholeplasmataceae bacterium]|nr:hypothetical protein [Acholeplasmataceae bacterium]